MKKMKLKPSETEHLIEAERDNLLQYACYRLGDMDEAEDVVQDVCLSLHCRLSEEGSAIRNPVAYLYRTLSNLCVTRLREAALHQEIPIDTLPEPADTETEDFEQEFRRISRLLCEIPDEQAEVIRLRFYGDKSFRAPGVFKSWYGVTPFVSATDKELLPNSPVKAGQKYWQIFVTNGKTIKVHAKFKK